jgi:hypothetical protein
VPIDEGAPAFRLPAVARMWDELVDILREEGLNRASAIA